MSFENRSLVIFGATGGIGSALGRHLAPLGCRLTLAGRDQSRLDTLSGELHAEACLVDATNSYFTYKRGARIIVPGSASPGCR